MTGIVSYGAYIPYHRLARSVIAQAWGRPGGRGEKAVANYDEDTVSMSVAAAKDCLNGNDPKEIDALYLATTSAPYRERQNSTIIANALGMAREIRNADFANCLRAGTTSVLSAKDAIDAGSAKQVLVTASDMRLGGASGENESNLGDGAAALLIGSDGVIAEIEGSYTISDDLADNWRAHDDTFVRSWEERFGLDEGFRTMLAEAAQGVMAKCGLKTEDFAKVCFYSTTSRRHAELGLGMGFAPEQLQDSLLDTVGNTGAALPLMTLVGALEEAKPGERILVVSWGNGCDAIVLKVTDAIEKARGRRGIKGYLEIKRPLESYETYLRWRGLVELESAARPGKSPTSMASLWREHRTAMPLLGVKCTQCGTPQLFLNMASTRARVCVECQAKDQFEEYRFADKRGSVATFSHDFLALSQDPPNTLTVVDFDGGGRGSFEMADRDPDECKVGMSVEMTFRKIFFDRGVHNYYWKCKPARD
jgi:3-hydroxy-3-methylglutaryl CoA synthase